MVGVHREVIEHKLMIKLGTKEIKQKKISSGERQEQGNHCRGRQTNQIRNTLGGGLLELDRTPCHG